MMRKLFVLFLGVLILGSFAVVAQGAEDWPSTDTPIVIVHGAWGGAHDWRFVEKALNAHGYEVRRVSLTGQGERSHLISFSNDFSTHVKDVTNLIEFEYAPDEKVVLVGHSYGGNVITAVASQIPERIDRMVYVDASITTPDMMDNKSYLGRLGGKGNITASNFLIAPFWPVFWDDPTGPKDVPHQAKTLVFPKSEFPKYEEAGEIPATFILLADDWVEGSEYEGLEKASIDKAKEKGYNIIGKPWGHNAHRDRTEEFYPVLLEAIAEAK